MKDGEYRITMLDCAEGDCFFLEFYFDSIEYTILMDTGPRGCWTTRLKPFLDQLIAKRKKINVLVITHIDDDHIGGAIKLFQSKEYSDLIEEVWFNGLKQVLNIDRASSATDNQTAYQSIIFQHRHNDFSDGVHEISAKQALSLGCLLTSCGKTTRRITCDTPPVVLTDNFRIDFLLPTTNQLISLQKHFLRHLRRVGDVRQIFLTPESEIAFEHLMRDDDTSDSDVHHISQSSLDIHRIEKWATAIANKDQSVTNTSSIAICISFYGKYFLFPGDAAGQDILEAIDNKKLPTDYEIIKLPHHGSNRNCLSLPEKLSAKKYLISTDGKRISHPGKETLAKLVTRHATGTLHLVFNYHSPMFELFHDAWCEDKYHYHSSISPIITNEEGDHS